jgi:hypothetical protein
MLLELPPIDPAPNTLSRGADLDHLDQDGDATFLDGGGAALAGADNGVEDVRGCVHHAGLRVSHEVQQGPHGAGLHGALAVLARTAAERVQCRGGVLLSSRAPGLEEGDQQRDNARTANGGRGGAVELGQPEQCARGVLPRGRIAPASTMITLFSSQMERLSSAVTPCSCSSLTAMFRR